MKPITPSKDQSWLSSESVGTRYVDEDGRVFAIINTRQTTEQLRVRAEMRHLEAQLRQSQKLEEIGRLAGGIAHDARPRRSRAPESPVVASR